MIRVTYARVTPPGVRAVWIGCVWKVDGDKWVKLHEGPCCHRKWSAVREAVKEYQSRVGLNRYLKISDE